MVKLWVKLFNAIHERNAVADSIRGDLDSDVGKIVPITTESYEKEQIEQRKS